MVESSICSSRVKAGTDRARGGSFRWEAYGRHDQSDGGAERADPRTRDQIDEVIPAHFAGPGAQQTKSGPAMHRALTLGHDARLGSHETFNQRGLVA
jgi:hypothetical protein